MGARIVPVMNSASFSVPLVAPGTEQTPRINQLDVAVSKRVTIGRIKLEPKVDVFNLLNSSDYFSVRTTTYQRACRLRPMMRPCRMLFGRRYEPPASA